MAANQSNQPGSGGRTAVTRSKSLFHKTVIQESSAGDQDAAQRRLEFLKPFPRLDITEEVGVFGGKIESPGFRCLPRPRLMLSTLRFAAVQRHEILLTWNCTHIANATLRSEIEAVCRSAGYEPPIVCTPQEMLGPGEQDA